MTEKALSSRLAPKVTTAFDNLYLNRDLRHSLSERCFMAGLGLPINIRVKTHKDFLIRVRPTSPTRSLAS